MPSSNCRLNAVSPQLEKPITSAIVELIRCTEDHLAGLRDLWGGGANVSDRITFGHEEAKMMYSGIDLHSNNSVVAIIDDADRVVAQKRLPNDIAKIAGFLARWQDELAGVVVESTYNWYWLVDGLQDAGLHASRQHGGDQAIRRPQAQRGRDGCAAPGPPAATGHP